MEYYTVVDTVQQTSDVRTIHLVDKNGTHPDFEAGQYITVYFPDLDVPEGKAYSLSSISNDPTMTITVKAIGPYSNRLCGLKVGDTVLVSQPYGFLYSDESSPLVCVAGGVGISPLWSIIRNSLRLNPSRSIKLLYSNKSEDDVIFHDEIVELSQVHPSLRFTCHVTRQKVADDNLYRTGRIDLSTVIKDELEVSPFFVLCGTVSFVSSMYNALQANEVQDDFISTETFFAS